MTNQRTTRWASYLAVAAGVLYNSWLLGYWLNPAVARHGLASELEAVHQPYNWLFTAADVVSSGFVLLVCWLLWRRRSAAVLASAAIFAAGTVADALLPMHCNPSLQRCPSFRVDHLLLVHGIFSIMAAAALFISLALLWWHDRKSTMLNGLMVGYVLFGFFSVLEALTPASGNWSQHYYLLLCGVWLALLPAAVWRSLKE